MPSMMRPRTGLDLDLRSIAHTPSRICWLAGEVDRDPSGVGPFDTIGELGSDVGAIGRGAADAGAGAVGEGEGAADVDAPTLDAPGTSSEAMLGRAQTRLDRLFKAGPARRSARARSAGRHESESATKGAARVRA